MRTIKVNGYLTRALMTAVTLALLAGCASTGQYSVGPGSAVSENAAQVPRQEASSGLSVLVPIMDPNIPENSDDFKAKAIWPELRRAEANRFSVKLRNALADTNAFDSVRVAPDQSATGHLYVNGKILQSNGEDLEIRITVIDITGKQRLNKTYKHRVKDYDLENPRSVSDDLYSTAFDQAAADVAKLARKLKSDHRETLKAVEEIRFAEAFSPNYFSGYIRTSKSGRTKLLALPSADDPMVKRIRALRVRDQMFIDNIQGDYDSFKIQMDKDYLPWQRQAFVESKAARKAKEAARAKIFLGALAVIGGAAMAANSDPYGNGAGLLGGTAVAVAGVMAIASGFDSSRNAKAHRDSLNELGQSLNIQLAPHVMELEGKTVELLGTASEQYQAWRAFLLDFYEQEQTPEVSL
jgi:hypothetical protein